MTQAAKKAEVNVSDELHSLELKKQALKRMIFVAQAVERLQNSLQAVLLLGKPVASIPKKVYQFVYDLNEKTRFLPSVKIKETIQQLDDTVSQSLAAVMTFAQIDQFQSADAVQHELHDDTGLAEISGLLDDFRKKSQTAIALRVLLKERGENVQPMVLPLDSKAIERQLTDIEEKEKGYRKRVETELVNLQKDARVIARNENLSPQVRESAAQVVEMLQRDIEHVRSGKPIDDMPIVLEVVEMGDEEHNADEADGLGDSVAESRHQSANAQTIGNQDVPASSKRGFLYKLFRWITTPPSVTWRDIDNKYRD